MKTMKKIASILLVLMMIQALAIPAFAEKNDSITINNAKVGETYNIYKLFDLIVDNENDPKAYSYTIDPDWAAFFAAAEGETPAGPGRQYINLSTDKGEEYVTAITNPAALAKAAANWASKPTADQTINPTVDKPTVKFDGLANGYWLVTSTLGTIAMADTTPDKADVTITEKNIVTTIDKEVKEDTTGKFGAENDAQIGDLIEFKSTVQIGKGSKDVVVHDKMDSGLTYTAGSVAIAGLTKGTDYTVNEGSMGDGCTFEITFTQSWIDGLNFAEDESTKTFEITYTATLNENAIKDDNGVAIVNQTNTIKVSFGENSWSESKTTTTTTHKFSVHKHATGNTDNLAGAVFKLMKGNDVVKLKQLDDNNYRVANGNEDGAQDTFKTVASGDIVIWGVDADADDGYQLVETKAPDGYNLLKDPVDVVVDENNSLVVDVENNTGSELPGTGGMGTTIFYVFGGTLVLAAIVLLVAKKRMNNAN